MFQFVTQFGPMMGELAARLEFLEMRVELLEGGARAPAAPGGAAPDGPDESFEMFGQTFDMKAMLEKGMPAGGMSGMMERLKDWKPGAKTAAAPAAPDAPPAAAPAPEKPT